MRISILLLSILLSFSVFSMEEESRPRFELGSIIGNQSLNYDSSNYGEKDYVFSYISFNSKLTDKSELKFSLMYRDFHDGKVSGEALEVNYTYFFKYRWELQTIYSPHVGNFLNKSNVENPDEIYEVISDSVQWKFLLGYTFITKKYYRVRLLGGLGYQFVYSMSSSSSVPSQPKDEYDKKGGYLYEISPIVEFRNDNDYWYFIGISYENKHLKTSELKDQNQEFKSIKLGLSFSL